MLITLGEFMQRIDESLGDLGPVENRIVVGDCLKAFRYLLTSSVDLIYTSPPYNIDKSYKGDQGDKKGLELYSDFLRQVVREMKRVLKPNGSLFWQTGYTQIPNGVPGDILPIDMLSYPFFREKPNALILWDRIIWRYYGGMAFKRKYTNRHETILWWVKPRDSEATPQFNVDQIRERSKELDKRNNFWGRNPGNVWEVDRVAFGATEQSSHIAVYPEEIAEKIVRASSNAGDLVLDPFSGSGTTPKVARSLGRRWIGFEISLEYARESVKRIGFQQPNEIDSLASWIIKSRVFGGRPASLAVGEVSRRLVLWAKTLKLEEGRGRFQQALSRVLEPEVGRAQKPEVWQDFDRLLRREPADPVVLADALLLRDYKNRRNLNGVSRYGTALEILQAVHSHILSNEHGGLNAYIERIIANEPSSFSLSGTNITLHTLEKRLKPSARSADLVPTWFQGVFDVPIDIASSPAGSIPEEGDTQESYQAKLPM